MCLSLGLGCEVQWFHLGLGLEVYCLADITEVYRQANATSANSPAIFFLSHDPSELEHFNLQLKRTDLRQILQTGTRDWLLNSLAT